MHTSMDCNTKPKEKHLQTRLFHSVINFGRNKADNKTKWWTKEALFGFGTLERLLLLFKRTRIIRTQ